ncbi:hypothetical protein HPB52_000272 [Rhipicephalus sanguineus]|uniref:Uncharacterized protein n=1 Tax=Rhipicephalus sanguineus TaxID=34632 RepID=A0A9D4SV75_RHISA|nr:hypothetical protein HPB52_000272 [Rhipicephalus sanguineus]
MLTASSTPRRGGAAMLTATKGLCRRAAMLTAAPRRRRAAMLARPVERRMGALWPRSRKLLHRMRSEVLQLHTDKFILSRNREGFGKSDRRSFLEESATDILRRDANKELLPDHVIFKRAEPARRG